MSETLVYVVTIPRPRDRFFQLYVLGSNGSVGDYYPNNNPNIYIGEQVEWYLGVTNNMGTAAAYLHSCQNRKPND